MNWEKEQKELDKEAIAYYSQDDAKSKKSKSNTKKERLDFPLRVFNGKLLKVEASIISGNTWQLLTVKEGTRVMEIVFPFTQSAPYKIGEERIWTVAEKTRNEVSYVIAQPEQMDKKKSAILKKFWSDAISCKITLDYDGKGSTIEWEKKGFIPYEKKTKKVKYYEVVNESLDLSFFTTQAKPKL
jgi:hypothetical protein